MLEEHLKNVSKESLEYKKGEIEAQYIGASVNIANVKKLMEADEYQNILTMEEIKELEWEEASTAKTNFMAYESLLKQLKDNEQALEIHNSTLLIINKVLWAK